MVQDWI
jgi:hypothetical protein